MKKLNEYLEQLADTVSDLTTTARTPGELEQLLNVRLKIEAARDPERETVNIVINGGAGTDKTQVARELKAAIDEARLGGR